jgi:hypothetical protein
MQFVEKRHHLVMGGEICFPRSEARRAKRNGWVRIALFNGFTLPILFGFDVLREDD